MHEHDESLRRALRQKQIEALALMRTIGDVELGTALPRELFAVGFRRRDPQAGPTLAPGDVRAVGVGVVPVLDGVQHEDLLIE
ncbi:conserved hypothetical protein [Bradyrhizobium oligotrophicum S58]|uniref:Uncharacterized protein n=1 Tax=Bradyrhizobium oligotrophicum S58 TaxID=1245469 RepID=M4Z3T8_9BRAD|nr:conserved hypothetical protein [Bradyrhizobium oligotrophicum S58]